RMPPRPVIHSAATWGRFADVLAFDWRIAMRKSDILMLVVVTLGLGQAAWGQVPEKRFITPDGKRPSGLFAPGVMVGKTLYIAGKGDYKPNEEFPTKVKNCLGEIEKTLIQAGLGFEHVVKSFVYLEDHDNY